MYTLNTLTNNRLLNKHIIKLAWIMAILVLLLVLLSISWSAWDRAQIKEVNYQPKEIEQIQAINSPSYRVSDIVSANLFGDPTPVNIVKEAPKTTLNLTLEGLLWSSDNSVGRAIIKSGKKASVLYSVGEEIKGSGAKVEEIRDNEVILNRTGALESLPIKTVIDSSNRIVITYPSEESIEEFEPSQTSTSQSSKTTSLQAVSNRQITAARNRVAENGDQSRRVRRPNFSGLDRALEKMGEL